MKAIFNILLEEWHWSRGIISKDAVDELTPNASTIIGLPGKATYHLANTNVGKGALAVGAGLLAARMLAKKYEEKYTKDKLTDPNASSTSEKKSKKEPDWVKKGRYNVSESIYEQNENLPRFPMLSYTQIPKNPRSVASFFMKRKPNNYDVNAEDDNIDRQRKMAAKNIKQTKAETGVDTVIGKLV